MIVRPSLIIEHRVETPFRNTVLFGSIELVRENLWACIDIAGVTVRSQSRPPHK